MHDPEIDAFLVSQGVIIHSDDAGDYLEHFGVKGMKWGVRSCWNFTRLWPTAQPPRISTSKSCSMR